MERVTRSDYGVRRLRHVITIPSPGTVLRSVYVSAAAGFLLPLTYAFILQLLYPLGIVFPELDPSLPAGDSRL